MHTPGDSRAQLARLVKRAVIGALLVKRHQGPVRGFARLYSEQDLALLAQTDTLHDTLSGPAAKRLLGIDFPASAVMVAAGPA